MERLRSLACSLVLVASLAGNARASHARFDVRDVLADPSVMQSLAGLMKAAGMGSQVEAAAFVVAAPDGSLSVRSWGSTSAHRQQNFRGRVPEGTVAIAHTHPANWERPSNGDIAEARRLGLPVYVLSRSAIRVIDGRDGQQVDLVTGRFWVREAASGSGAEQSSN